MENLLAFIEFSQIQKHLMEKTEIESSRMIMEFPSNIPLSSILATKQSDDTMVDLKKKAHDIYEKYVSVGSEFEINISSDVRQKAANMFGDLHLLLDNKSITGQDIFDVIDGCKWEIWELLLGAQFRFRMQPEYDEFKLEEISEQSPTVEIVLSQSETNLSL